MTKEELKTFKDWFSVLTEDKMEKPLSDAPFSFDGIRLVIGGKFTGIRIETFMGNSFLSYHGTYHGKKFTEQPCLVITNPEYDPDDGCTIQEAKEYVLKWLELIIKENKNNISSLEHENILVRELCDSKIIPYIKAIEVQI